MEQSVRTSARSFDASKPTNIVQIQKANWETWDSTNSSLLLTSQEKHADDLVEGRDFRLAHCYRAYAWMTGSGQIKKKKKKKIDI